jgi:hypothetical protein
MESGERIPIALLMVGRAAHGHKAGLRIVERPDLLRPDSLAGEAARAPRSRLARLKWIEAKGMAHESDTRDIEPFESPLRVPIHVGGRLANGDSVVPVSQWLRAA